jgi:hypothetical protein
LGAYFCHLLSSQRRNLVCGFPGYTVLTFILWIILGDKNLPSISNAAIGYSPKPGSSFLMDFF